MVTKPKKAKKRKELTPAQKHELEKRNFAKSVRTVFERIGFKRAGKLADIEIEFDGRKGDFDDAYILENLVVFVEYTVSNPSQVGDHIKGKAHLFRKIYEDPDAFLKMMRERFADLSDGISGSYHSSQIIVKILYCSKSEVKQEHRDLTPDTSFLWYGSIKYFLELSAAIKHSARFEMLDFFKIDHMKLGKSGTVKQSVSNETFQGSILPEAYSGFPDGFKVISFYVSPAAVLSRAYVLRKDGWQDSDGLYQRMISRKKIESIRRYLRSENRVFVNNVILTLPHNTSLLDVNSNKEVMPHVINEVKPIKVVIPECGNTIGIVDGQHRIFSYYEDAEDDEKIKDYRNRQNLLATGILYPTSYTARQRERFEASLFLEINSTQNAASSPLKQAIAVITKPYSEDAVSKRVAQILAGLSALDGLLERSFYDVGVLRTTTIVSYGLKPLVRIGGEDSLFRLWGSEEDRQKLKDRADLELLAEYTHTTAKQINQFLSAARSVVGSSRWKLVHKDGDGILTVTLINGFLALFRHYIRACGIQSFEEYRVVLAPLKTFEFSDFKSSRYFAMGSAMFKMVFGKEPPTASS